MRKDCQMRVIERRQHALGHRVAVHAEAGMNRPDYVVEGIQYVRVVIDAAVGENVSLDSLENSEALKTRIQLVDFLMLSQESITLETTRIERRLGVIRDADVIPTALHRALGKLLHCRDAVRIVRVTVQNATQILVYHEIGHLSPSRYLDLAHAFAHFRGNRYEIQRREESVFVR